MSDFQKKLLGILTAWPFAYFVLFILFVIGLIATQPGDLGPIGGFSFLLLMLLHFLTIALIIGLQIYYIINVFKNDRIGKDQRVLWVLVLFFGGLFAMPIYWYLNIWRDPPMQYRDYGSLAPGDAFESAEKTSWEERTGDPVPPEPHSWR